MADCVPQEAFAYAGALRLLRDPSSGLSSFWASYEKCSGLDAEADSAGFTDHVTIYFDGLWFIGRYINDLAAKLRQVRVVPSRNNRPRDTSPVDEASLQEGHAVE